MTAPARESQESWSEFPAGTSLVAHNAPVPDLASPQQIAAYSRAFDDEAFLASIVGEAMDKWFYEFSIGGKNVEGVSVVGAEEFARLRAEQGFPIRFPPGSIRAEEVTRNGELGIQVTVIAREARSGADGLGMAFYPYMVERKKGDETVRVADNFPDRKALSVAKRNAILDLIPTATVIGVLKQRKAILAANANRAETQVRSALESSRAMPRQQVAQRVIGSGAANTDTPVMRFGKTKGTPLAQLSDKEVMSACAWARTTDADKFADAIAELDAEILRRQHSTSNTQGEIPGMDAGVTRGTNALAQP